MRTVMTALHKTATFVLLSFNCVMYFAVISGGGGKKFGSGCDSVYVNFPFAYNNLYDGTTHFFFVAWFKQILGAFAKLQKSDYCFVVSARLHGTTRFLLDGISRNLIFEFVSKIC